MKEKTLIIAEKLKAAKVLMNGLGEKFVFHQTGPKMKRCQSGYYESDSKIVTYARGHLFRLLSIEEYFGLPVDAPRRMDVLPYIPKEFRINVSEDEQNFCSVQFETIKKLIQRSDVTKIVNFGDPDCEGELLIREILTEAQNTKPVERLWCNELLEDPLVDAFYNLKKENDFVNYYYKAKARQETDWLLGINLSRYLKVKTGEHLPVGRVLIPIVKYIYDRDKTIKEFNSTCSYGIEATVKKDTFNKNISISKPEIYFDEKNKKDCEALAEALNKKEKIVTNIKNANKEIRPNKFFDLTDFRSQMNIRYKCSVAESSQIAQSLYEAGFISYPRTSTQYLSEKSKSAIKVIINKLVARGLDLNFRDDKSIFDDTKLSSEGHTALIITTKLPTKNELNSLSQQERNGYQLIFNRTVSNFCEFPLIKETSVEIKAGDYLFKLTGHTVLREGFLKYETRALRDALPIFNVGEKLDMTFCSVKRDTRPPKKVSVTELGSYLKFPYSDVLKKMDKNDDALLYKMLKEGISIGTEATIPGIITKAIAYGYIADHSTTYSITEKGCALIQILDNLKINLYRERNIEMNKQINAVSNKDITLHSNKMTLKKELEGIFKIGNTVNITVNFSDRELIGKCPKCGKPVYLYNSKIGKMYGCSGYKEGCNFRLFENDHFFNALGKKMNKTMAKSLLKNKSVDLKNLVSKKGNKYSLHIIADLSGPYPKYETSFLDRKDQ